MIQICTLCEAATLHDGLLNVLGAGITRIARPGFPGALGLTLVILEVISAEEAASQNELEVQVELLLEGDSQGTFRFSGIKDPSVIFDPIAPVAGPLALPLPFVLTGPGSYTIRVTAGGETFDILLRVDLLRPPEVVPSSKTSKAAGTRVKKVAKAQDRRSVRR